MDRRVDRRAGDKEKREGHGEERRGGREGIEGTGIEGTDCKG